MDDQRRDKGQIRQNERKKKTEMVKKETRGICNNEKDLMTERNQV